MVLHFPLPLLEGYLTPLSSLNPTILYSPVTGTSLAKERGKEDEGGGEDREEDVLLKMKSIYRSLHFSF